MLTLTEEMFSTGKPFAQGEILIWMKKYAPKTVLNRMAALKNLQEMPLQSGMMILGHSKTGHHHVLESASPDIPISQAAQALVDAANDTFVELRLYHNCALVHQRSADAHETVLLPPGEYIRGVREEQTINGWVRVAD